MASNLETTEIPERLPLIFLPNGILLPGGTLQFRVTSTRNVKAIQSIVQRRQSFTEALLGIAPTDPSNAGLQDVEDEDLLVGAIVTAARIVQVSGTTWPRTVFSLTVRGVCRVRIVALLQVLPYAMAVVKPIEQTVLSDDDVDNLHPEVKEMIIDFKQLAKTLLSLAEGAKSDNSARTIKLQNAMDSVPLQKLTDLIGSIIKASFRERLDILNAENLEDQIRAALPLLRRQVDAIAKSNKNKGKAIIILRPNKSSRSDANKAGLLMDPDEDDASDIEAKLQSAELPQAALKVVTKELNRLKKMSPQMMEYNMLRQYIELVADLPWNKASEENIDLKRAREDLDRDHHAMDKVKTRVLEYLAVRQLKNNLNGPILCFVGPPGVGKTSIGRSIAKTLGRQFHRISVGGVSDQSDIRGHRRTYIGSMPGRIIQGLLRTGVNNPVFLLDEVDKMTAGIHGDPAAALLEVLDPEQNSRFVDHYVNIPFDLSQVLFIATANTLKTIPWALRDRMEIIEVPGYSPEDKVPIASNHIIPKQLELHGLTDQSMVITDDIVKLLVTKYTREAGVRQLERNIGAICRAIALKVAEGSVEDLRDAKRYFVDQKIVEEVLGNAYSETSLKERLCQPGVALGLAWTNLGGQVMVVEATRMAGDGKITLTGQLGDVMKESATIAINWIRAHTKELCLPVSEGNFLENVDIHIHFPAGAVEKDGPSAGVTILTALVSLFTKKKIAPGIAMSGEMTLRGVVLPVGGIKEKVLAAYREGITTIVLPAANGKDLKDVPQAVKEAMEIKFVRTAEEVLDKVLPSNDFVDPDSFSGDQTFGNVSKL